MDPYWSDANIALHLGDCIEILAEMATASVDAVVTDPPYGLEFMGREWDSFKPSGARLRTRADARTNPAEGASIVTTPESYTAGQPFQAWCQRWASECLRVLRPGGHMLAFGGTRTWHRLACGIEDAGFEVRDSMHWIYGSGFPKSLDVSKAIDRTKRRDYVLAAVHLGLEIPGNNLHDWTKAEHSPSDAWWARFKDYLSSEDWQRIEREVIGEGHRIRRESTVQIVGLSAGAYDLTAAATEDAAQWDGWGTALKPAHEPIIVARKPLAGTVAQNVLQHGTGALNIEGCRVNVSGRHPEQPTSRDAAGSSHAGSTSRTFPLLGDGQTARTPSKQRPASSAPSPADRNGPLASAPARVTDCPLPQDSPDGCPTSPCFGDEHALSEAGDGQAWPRPRAGAGGPRDPHATPGHIPSDQSTPPGHSTAPDVEREPSRAGEASSETRYTEQGGTDFAPLPGVRGGDPAGRWPPNVLLGPDAAAEMDRQSGVTASRIGSPRSSAAPGDGYGMTHTGAEYADQGGTSRFFPVFRYQAKAPSSERPRGEDGTAHPTVKPVDLMRWLVRLVTPADGLVLDPFGGSGTTAEACLVEGFRCVLIEKDPAYAELIRTRLRKDIQPDLFGGAA